MSGISESEFLMIRQFDRNLVANADSAQRIINAKNRTIVSLEQEIVRLRAALNAETGARKLAQMKLRRQ